MARRKQLRLLVGFTLVWALWAIWFFASGRSEVDLLIVDEEGAPVVGAAVSAGGNDLAVTDAAGLASVAWSRSSRAFDLTAPGYSDVRIEVSAPSDEPVKARLRSRILRGEVVDDEGRPIEGVYVSAGFGEAVTGRSGEFLVRLAEPGQVRVWRPAWEAGDFEWDGSPGARTLTIQPRVVKAVHVAGEVAGDAARWSYLVGLTETTDLNAMMLDLKDEDGIVYYDTAVEIAHQAGAVVPKYDLAAHAREMADRGVYLIGRIVTFQDPRAARTVPEMAIGNRETGGVFNKGGQYFLDPTDPQARAYALALAEEACRAGVDEIQFDYVRYPDGFGEVAVFDGGSDEDTRIKTIESFLREARVMLHELGCAVAGDIFGFITTATDDGGIGQQWEVVTDVLDVVSPMLYPSHYDSGWYGFDRPIDNPGGMVSRALRDGIGRLDSGAVIRPWLQDFGYDDAQVREQIDAAEEYGLGWMLWNAFSVVSEGALTPKAS